jgi:hypothetical protein
MKTVFSTHAEVAHAWGQQDSTFGRSATPSGSFNWRGGDSSADGPRVRFAGRVFYSYDTPVARLEPNRHGALVLLHRESAWGPATRGHIGDACGAVRHLIDSDPADNRRGRRFEVPHVGGYADSIDWIQRQFEQDRAGYILPPPVAVDHVGNFAHLVAEYRAGVESRLRKRGELWAGYIPGWKWEPGQPEGAGRYTVAETVERELLGLWASAIDYADFFGPLHVPADFPATREAVKAEAAAIMAEREARAARALAKLTPKEIARREAAKAERAAKREREKALQFADAAEKLAGWREGLNLRYGVPYGDGNGCAYIRATGVKRKAGEITGGTLETSQGARVPLRDAIRVFRFLKCVRDSGKPWEASAGRHIRVGQFHVNRVDPTGDFIAGCHRFAWGEIEALAERLGVAFLPCDAAAFAEVAA